MKIDKEAKALFKPYFTLERTYKGGITKDELSALNKKIYKLSSNENLMGTSPKALAAIQDSLENLNEYPDRTGQALQDALALFYDNQISPDQFLCANSGSECIELIVRGFSGIGFETIVSSPCFLPYEMFSRWQGAKIINVPLLAPNFGLDVEGILNRINDQTRLLFLTSPNNPTGTYLPEDQLDYLIDQIPDHVVTVIDEVYYHYAEAKDFVTAQKYVKQGKQVIGLNSFSKTFGLASVRSGYAYSTPEIAGYLRQICRPFLINKLTLAASIAALSDRDFLQKTINSNHQERERLYKAFEKLNLHYWKSQANFILVRPQMEAEDLVKQLLQEGIMVRPSANFGAPGCVRITIGTPEANTALIAGLEKVLG